MARTRTRPAFSAKQVHDYCNEQTGQRRKPGHLKGSFSSNSKNLCRSQTARSSLQRIAKATPEGIGDAKNLFAVLGHVA